MKHQALFSSIDKGKKIYSVVCCNFAWHFKAKIQNDISRQTVQTDKKVLQEVVSGCTGCVGVSHYLVGS